MELIFQASYTAETTPNGSELFGGAPVLYLYTNQKPAKPPLRINYTETRDGKRFSVRFRLPEKLQTYAQSELIIGIGAFTVTQTKENRVGFIHAGTTAFTVTSLLSAGTIFSRPLLIQHGLPVSVQKGTLRIAREDISMTGNVALIRGQEAYIQTRFVDMYNSVAAQLSTHVRQAFYVLDRRDGNALPPAFALSRNIRATVWHTAAGALPFAAFWSLRNRFALSEHYWLHLLNTILDRYDLTQHRLMRTLHELREWKPGYYRSQGDNEDAAREHVHIQGQVRRVGSVLANMLTAFVNALPYLTDKFVTREGRAILIEWFDHIRQRLSGDCEDDGTEIFKLFTEFTAESTVFNTPVLTAMQTFARAYVCVGMLGAVTTQSLKSGSGAILQEDETKYPAHIWAMLVPTGTWAEWRYGVASSELNYTVARAPQWVRTFGEMLACEGTGHMNPVVGSRETPEPTRATKVAAKAKRIFFKRHFSLRGLAHSSGLVDAPKGRTSPFYRQCQFGYASKLRLGRAADEFVEELYFVDRQKLSHGVTFDALTRYKHGSGSVQVRPLAPMPLQLQRDTVTALENLCPDPPLVVPNVPIAHPFAHNLVGEKLVGADQSPPPNTTALHLWVPLDTINSLFTHTSTQGVPLAVRREIDRALNGDASFVKSARYRYEAFDTHVVQLRITLYLATDRFT
jgi:hypothetical protein